VTPLPLLHMQPRSRCCMTCHLLHIQVARLLGSSRCKQVLLCPPATERLLTAASIRQSRQQW